MRRFIFVAALLAAGLASVHAKDAKPVEVQEILSTLTTAGGQPIVLPQGPVRLIATTYDIAPGAQLPVHKHPFPRYGYVLAGTLTVTDTESGKTYDYKRGDFIVELVDRWHFGKNAGSEPLKLLVIDQVPDGQKATVLQGQ